MKPTPSYRRIDDKYFAAHITCHLDPDGCFFLLLQAFVIEPKQEGSLIGNFVFGIA